MSRQPVEDSQSQDSTLVLFVTGNAPRSRRALHNLTAVFEVHCLKAVPLNTIDLLQDPQQAIHLGIFATPALMHVDASGHRRILYGDLSDERSLKDFLSGL
ncbi:circadian clock KaiB family protein [Roseovarius tibetensis]|uniref:circadian clock KaiB family protein n=1 Tax=Roseovarius tibetensis TaxID=2685897 RepID=UPI003D7F9A20